VVGGSTVTGTVALSSAPSGAAVVTLQRNNTTVASLPANVSIGAGNTSATFTVTTTAVTATTAVVITASFSGASLTATLTVTPAAPVASFFVRSTQGVDNRCQLRTDFTLDCAFNGSASTGSPVAWIWTYKIGANSISMTTNTAILNLPGTTIQGNTCGLFNGQTSGSPASLAMIVQLQVRNAAGVTSTVVENQNVSVFPSGSNTCGF
jgi:hypothetical protein